MFNGAKKYGPKQFDNEMEKAGGNNNAYTSQDVTVYTDWFPNTALELMFDMEADRMQNLAFDPKIVESERGVVYSERRTSVDNSNCGMLYEQLRAAAFTAHPYHWPVVGWPSDIEAWTMDDLRAHYKTGYAPNNCVMVVVGDVPTSKVMTLAKKYIEPIPPQPPPPAVRTKEPEQIGERRVTVRKAGATAAAIGRLSICRKRRTRTLTVLEVIDAHSDRRAEFAPLQPHGGSGSDGAQCEAADRSARSIRAFSFSRCTPRSGVAHCPDGEGAVRGNREAAAPRRCPGTELRKAKNQLLAQHYRQLKTIAGRANLLGTYEVFRGDYNKLFTSDRTEIEAVTAADVQRVAAPILRREEPNRGHPDSEVRRQRNDEASAVSGWPWPASRVPRMSGCRSTRAEVLPNGAVRLSDAATRACPLVNFRIVVKGGVESEPADRRRDCRRSPRNCFAPAGAPHRQSVFRATWTAWAAVPAPAPTSNNGLIGSEFLKKDFAAGLDLTADAVLHPAFPEAEVKKVSLAVMDGARIAERQSPGCDQPIFPRVFLRAGPPLRAPGRRELAGPIDARRHRGLCTGACMSGRT